MCCALYSGNPLNYSSFCKNVLTETWLKAQLLRCCAVLSWSWSGRWRKRVQPGSMHSLRGYFRHWGINWGNGMEKKSPCKREFPVSSLAAAPHMWNVRVPGWLCSMLMRPVASQAGQQALEHMEIVLLCPFLLHHIHCRAASGVVQGEVTMAEPCWESGSLSTAPLLSPHEKRRRLISQV